ncbi:MAG TPA: bifunctional diaminohydroxyphosphoribosylaminopyrimidine deaminase/5-amino-6-(5-phosphoribosylamino)uracil reductase RibD, partial [Vicinamibacteria bacterium]
MAADDRRFMLRALALANRGAGETNPNPLVGCVIVRAGVVVGEGWHQRAGGPHAEVMALERAGLRARGATLYVNLEPCAHRAKRTPPCAPAVAAAGLRRVVVAMRDPNPAVEGRGLALLRRSGIQVTSGVLAEEARRLNRPFAVAQKRQGPFVLLKAALTLDGRIATASGESRWITTGAQRREARALRRRYDGVLVGIGTALLDDPMLLPTPRPRRPFFRIVLDSRLRLPLRGRLVGSARRSPVIVLGLRGQASRRRALEARGVTVLVDPRSTRRVSLSWAMRALWRHGLRSVMVEGGSEVLGSFLAARLVDQVALFRAPLLLGGRGSRPAFGGPDPKRLVDAIRLDGPALAPCEMWFITHPGRSRGLV